jgi:hypothetical protein
MTVQKIIRHDLIVLCMPYSTEVVMLLKTVGVINDAILISYKTPC